MTKWTDDEIEQAKGMIVNNVTYEQVANTLGKTVSSVQTKMYRLGIRSNYLSKSFKRRNRIGYNGVDCKYERYDWASIQRFYDNKGTYRSVQSEFNVSHHGMRWAVKNGLLLLRSKSDANKLSRARTGPRTLSEDTKAKISISRKRYLDANPHMVPYLLNHSSKVSFPEKIFMDELNRRGITGWEYNYQFGRYAFDIAFPGIKLDVEIDGGTHLQEKVAQKDAERDAFAVQNGWTVLRFTAKEVKADLKGCVDKVCEFGVGR